MYIKSFKGEKVKHYRGVVTNLKVGGAQIQERCKTCNIKKLRCKTCNIKPLSKLNERTSNSAFKVD